MKNANDQNFLNFEAIEKKGFRYVYSYRYNFLILNTNHINFKDQLIDLKNNFTRNRYKR